MTSRRRTLMDDVVERMARAAASGEDIVTEQDHCAKCGRGKAEGLRIFVRLLTTDAEIDTNVGLLNAIDPYMRRKPGDQFKTYVLCPCCSGPNCPDTERGHRLAELGQLLRNWYVTRVAWEWPLVAVTTTPDHPEWQETWPGGPIHRVAADATCCYGNIWNDKGEIVGYVPRGACGRPQCQPEYVALALAAEHTGDPDDCWSGCQLCFPSALVLVAA